MLKSSPKVSICITTQNRYALLEETLESIKLQTFFDYEVIVWDNGQYSNVVVSKFDARFKYYTNEERSTWTMAQGFNKALSLAAGDYVLFLSDDDLLYPKALEVLTEHLDISDMTIGGTDMLQDDVRIAQCTFHKLGINSCISPVLPKDDSKFLTNNQFAGALLTNPYKMYLFWSAALVRRDIAIKAGGFPDYGTTLMGDFVYILNAAKHCQNVMVTNTAVCAQRVHALNHGRVSHCRDIKIIRKTFLKECGDIVGAEPFVSGWMVGHCTFLKQYFNRLEIPNRLSDAMWLSLTLKEHLKVHVGYHVINFLNFIRSLG